MYRSSPHLEALGLPGGDRHELPATPKRFPDGAAYRVEIPSVEGPAAMRVVLSEAARLGVRMRHYEAPYLVRCGAPIYLKYTVRNAPGTYPSGAHLQPVVESLSAERVRRAALGLALLHRYLPEPASRR